MKSSQAPQGHEKPRYVPRLVSREELGVVPLSRETISAFIEWAANVPVMHKDAIRGEIARVAGDDALVLALCEELSEYADDDPARQFLLLATIGETRNQVAVSALVKLVWREPPPQPEGNRAAGLADTGGDDVLIGLQARAAEMLSYIGGEEADRTVLDAVAKHPAKAVRVAAIDAHLFNRDDSEEAKEEVRKVAGGEEAKLIGLPRFGRDADRSDFDARVREYYEANAGDRPPPPQTQTPPKRGPAPPRADNHQPRRGLT